MGGQLGEKEYDVNINRNRITKPLTGTRWTETGRQRKWGDKNWAVASSSERIIGGNQLRWWFAHLEGQRLN